MKLNAILGGLGGAAVGHNPFFFLKPLILETIYNKTTTFSVEVAWMIMVR